MLKSLGADLVRLGLKKDDLVIVHSSFKAVGLEGVTPVDILRVLIEAVGTKGTRMSDMGFVNQYGGFPCLIFGATRWGQAGMAHQPDEYVEIRRVMECLKTVVFCAMEWCGYETI
jgi:acetylornithine deacetylase/succinyl-diaminopimelate desuccinylase-like protein